MTWVNLDDVYVSTSGGTINGNLAVNGSLTCKNGSTTYNVGSQLATLGDSVSQYKVIYDTDTWYIYTISNVVFVYCYGAKTSSGSWDSITCPYTLIETYCPKKTVIVPLVTENGGSWTGALIINTTGVITVSNYGNSGSTDSRCGMACYPITRYTGTAYTPSEMDSSWEAKY